MADDPGYRLESPALGIPRRYNQALVERVRVCGCRWANVVENEQFLALGQMGTKKAKMAMEEVNENKDGISESTCNSNAFTFMPYSDDIAISIHHSNFVSSRS